uniref:15-hydroxyprostaglandin dehydrogenase [NAD(+)] n=1 Tax=Heliothis virescens TaxID=7102 RepID=A0A2A4JJW8_HELVI
MDRNPKDKVVVITGAVQGIGYDIANQFLNNGAKTLILLDTNEVAGVAAARKFTEKYGKDKAVFIKCDITKDLEKVSSGILQKYEVDVLINNAGILDETDVRKTIEINCIALVEWSMKFFEHWRVDRGGRPGRSTGEVEVVLWWYLQCSFNLWIIKNGNKYAVMGFTRSLGHPFNYKKTGVRVIAICPGFTEIALLTGKPWDIHKEESQKYMEEASMQEIRV